MTPSELLETTVLDEALLDDDARCEDSAEWEDEDTGVTHNRAAGQCERSATWVGRLRCGHPLLFCEIHHEETVSTGYVTVHICRCGAETSQFGIVWARI